MLVAVAALPLKNNVLRFAHLVAKHGIGFDAYRLFYLDQLFEQAIDLHF